MAAISFVIACEEHCSNEPILSTSEFKLCLRLRLLWVKSYGNEQKFKVRRQQRLDFSAYTYQWMDDKFEEGVLTPLAFIRSFKVIAINSEVKAVVSWGRYVIVLP